MNSALRYILVPHQFHQQVIFLYCQFHFFPILKHLMFLFGGYVLISYFYEVTMEREVEGAVEQYQYNKFVVQANLITRGEDWFAGAAEGQYDISSMASDMNGTVAFLAADVLVSPRKGSFHTFSYSLSLRCATFLFRISGNRRL